MTETLRAVEALKMPDVVRAEVRERPRMEWLALDTLVINDEYQRSLSEKSVRAIRRMVANFDWARLKALSVVDVGDGKFEVIDGQHTAIAAASHGGIDAVPCLIAPMRSLQARAGDFVGINRDRVSMTPMQVFWAEVAAEDEIAVEVLRGVELGGGRLLTGPPAFGRYKVGDVIAIGALKSLAKNGGPAWVKRAVSVCVEATLAPISANILKAMMLLLWEGRHAGQITDDQIIAVLRIHGGDAIQDKARTLRHDLKKPIGECVAEVISRLA